MRTRATAEAPTTNLTSPKGQRKKENMAKPYNWNAPAPKLPSDLTPKVGDRIYFDGQDFRPVNDNETGNATITAINSNGVAEHLPGFYITIQTDDGTTLHGKPTSFRWGTAGK
jgi:hypothetical protein